MSDIINPTKRQGKCYKVVYESLSGEYFSANQNSSFPQKLKVKYQIGEWARPNKEYIKNSRLFVFGDIDDAHRFCGWCEQWKLFEAEYMGYPHIARPLESFAVKLCMDANINEWGQFYSLENREKLEPGSTGWFMHNAYNIEWGYTVSAIKLIKQIEKYD